MVNNPCTENCHKKLIGYDKRTGLCPICQDMDIFLVLYTYESKYLLTYEPTWQLHTIDDKSH